MSKILFLLGTRPEAIKLAPLILEFKKKNTHVILCLSSQHKNLVKPILNFFNIQEDHNLNIMEKNQTLFSISSKCLSTFEKVLDIEKPDLIIVQGDTTTAFIGALSGAYKKIPVAHIEAGLRTFNKEHPFPEELNRKLISECSTYHFSPTQLNKENLKKQGIKKNVWVVGNTVIDALKHTDKVTEKEFTPQLDTLLLKNKKVILVTGHRRENHGVPFKLLCEELIKLSKKSDIAIFFPFHLNPNTHIPSKKYLSHIKNIHLLEPLNYPDFVWLMKQSSLIITDSGGIQEESPYFGIPTFVTRKVTERKESLSNNCVLIDINKKILSEEVLNLLNNSAKLQKMSHTKNIYGNGNSSKKIATILKKMI